MHCHNSIASASASASWQTSLMWVGVGCLYSWPTYVGSDQQPPMLWNRTSCFQEWCAAALMSVLAVFALYTALASDGVGMREYLQFAAVLHQPSTAACSAVLLLLVGFPAIIYCRQFYAPQDLCTWWDPTIICACKTTVLARQRCLCTCVCWDELRSSSLLSVIRPSLSFLTECPGWQPPIFLIRVTW